MEENRFFDELMEEYNNQSDQQLMFYQELIEKLEDEEFDLSLNNKEKKINYVLSKNDKDILKKYYEDLIKDFKIVKVKHF